MLFIGLVQGNTLLDLGSGPLVTNVLVGSSRCNHIVMSDLVEANRLELMKWLNKDEDALDWTFRAEKVAVVEGYTYVAVFKLLTQYLVYELYNARLPIFCMKLF